MVEVVVRCCWDARDDADADLDMVLVLLGRCCWDARDDEDVGLDLEAVFGRGGGGACKLKAR